MLKLFYAPGACSLASHIALAEAGADYELQRLDFRAGEQRQAEYLAQNPKGKVPALVTDRGVLTENPVILGYVAQTFPDARLAPNDDSFAFGAMQAFNMFLSSSVHIAFNHIFRPENWVDGEAAQAAVKEKAKATVKKHFALVEEALGDRGSWVGSGYTVSDGYLYVFERWYGQMAVGDLAADFPRIAGHMRRVQERPAVQRALAEEGLEPA